MPRSWLRGVCHEELDIALPELTSKSDNFEAKVEAALATDATAFSFTFGIPPTAVIEQIKARGMLAIGTATTVQEAVLLEQAGFEAIVAQGGEAGGHRGTFAAPFHDALIGTMALVPQIADAVNIPVIASGGIMDGRGIVAALILGASAVQMGTAFLTCAEAGIAEVHKTAILNANPDDTRVTSAFSGRPARGIINRFMDTMDSQPDHILPYPYQNVLTRLMRRTAAQQGHADYLSLWAGQGVGLAQRQTTAELMQRLTQEITLATQRISPVDNSQ